MPASFRSRFVLPAGLAFGLLAAAPLSSLAQTNPPAPPAAPAPAAPAAAPAPAPVPAAAPVALLPVSPEGAREIAKQIDDFIALMIASKQTKATFEWKGGSPSVTPAGDRYDIAAPAMLIRWPGDASMELSATKIQAIPQPDGTLAVTGALPTRVVLLDKGKEEGTVTLDQAAFSGLWSSAYQTLLTGDLSAGPGHLSFVNDGTKGEFASLTLKQALLRDHDDLFSGTGNWSLTGLNLKDKDGKPLFSLGKLGSEASLTRIDLARLAKLRDTLRTLPPDQVTPDKLLPLVRGLLAGVTATVSGESLRFTPPGEPSDAGVKAFSVTTNVDSLDADAANARMTLDVSDVFGPFPADVAPVVPTKTSLALKIEHLPTDILTQLANVPGGVDSPAVPGVLLAAVQKTGVVTTLESLTLDTPAAGTTAKGSLVFSPTAAQGATGSMVVTMRGLDAVIKMLKPSGKPAKGKKDDTDGIVAVLTMLQVMGQPGKDEQGRDLRTFNLDLAADGSTKLNGADLSGLMNLGQGAPAKDEAKKPAKDEAKKPAKPAKPAKKAVEEDDDEDEAPPPVTKKSK